MGPHRRYRGDGTPTADSAIMQGSSHNTLHTDRIASHQPQESGTTFVNHRVQEILNDPNNTLDRTRAEANASKELFHSNRSQWLQYMQHKAQNLPDIPGLPSHQPDHISSSSTPTEGTFTGRQNIDNLIAYGIEDLRLREEGWQARQASTSSSGEGLTPRRRDTEPASSDQDRDRTPRPPARAQTH